MIRFKARGHFPGNASLGEGPIWHNDALWWVDILNGEVLCSDRQGTRTMKQMPGTVSKVLPRKGGGYVVLGETDIHVVDENFTEMQRIAVLPKGGPTRLSDGTVGPAGEIWFGTMRYDMRPGGSLYRLRAGETQPTLVLDGLGMPNGIAFAPDQAHLYFVDSSHATVTAYTYDENDQHIQKLSVLATVDTERYGTPDGIAVDVTGAIWVAHFAGGRVRRLELDGTWSQEIIAPAENLTSCVFGGSNMQTLFITSATVELDDASLSQQPGAGSIFAITLPVGGMESLEATL